MSRWTREAILYKYRTTLSGLLLLTIFYFVVFSRVSLPPLTLFIGWHPDTKLTVLPVIEETYRQYMEPSDVVLAIDGRPARRGDLIFIPPVKSTYQLTLQRGSQVFIQDIPVVESQLFALWELSKGVLALIIWLIAFITVQFARQGQFSALYVGFGFQLIAAGIVSPGPAQLGAPGAWIVGHVLIFYFPLIMLYLSFMPRSMPMSPAINRLLRRSFYLLSGLALLAAFEVLFLFPERSLADVIGVRSLTIITVLAGMSIVAAVVILLTRLIKAPRRSYDRQQLVILFVFLALAVMPLFFFVILPVDQTAIFAPFPFVYSVFLLAPAGYFFVLHRQGYLELDAIFGRIVTVVVLIFAIGMSYATAVYLLDAVFHLELGNIAQGIFMLGLFGIATVSQKQVQEWVDTLLFGHDLLGDESIQEVKAKLSANPEPATVTDVVRQIATYLNVEQAAVVVKDDEQYTLLAGNATLFVVPSLALEQEVQLRARDPGRMSDLPQWVELSIPITARGDMLGSLLLSRPFNGYFNARQVKTLQDSADILAFSLLVISLVEAMNDLSRQALYEKELQRQQIATEIHNEPLHSLTTLMMQLQTEVSENVIQDAARTIRQVTRDLRRIISGLRPPVLKEAIEWITRQVVREFDETHEGIAVTLHLDVRSGVQAAEPTKLAFHYILTETLNNVSKHAQATSVDVTLCYTDDVMTLTVCDNGVGPGVATRPLTELLRNQHIGVADMHRWASVGAGTLEIGTSSPSGTVVKLILPTITPPQRQLAIR